MKNPAVWFCFLTLFVISSCVNDPEKVKSITHKNTLPVQAGKGIDLLYSDSARLKIHLTAPEVNEYTGNDPYTEMPKGVKVEFYDSVGKVETSLTANYAIRKERNQMMEAKNDVVLVNTKGETLNTEHLIWDGNKRRISTKAAVKITTKDQIIMGTGLESDEMFNDYEIKNITGTFMLKDEDKTDE
jgi:LPS export ABC transporter protein LptC